MRPAAQSVNVQAIRERVGQDGRVQPTEAMDAAARAMLADLEAELGGQADARAAA
jgi:hypothetical protein